MSLSLAARLPGSHRPRVALLAAFAMIAVALVLGLRLVWQPYAASSSVPVQASLDGSVRTPPGSRTPKVHRRDRSVSQPQLVVDVNV